MKIKIKTGVVDQWRIAIWKQSMSLLAEIVGPYTIPGPQLRWEEMRYKLVGYL